MILQELCDLAQATGWAKSTDFVERTVHWLLRIDARGQPLRDTFGNLACWFPIETDLRPGSKQRRALGRKFPELPRVDRPNQNYIRPDFFVGRADRLLFAAGDDSPAGKTRAETGRLASEAGQAVAGLRQAWQFYQILDADVTLREQLLSTFRECLNQQKSDQDPMQQMVALSFEQDNLVPAFQKAEAKEYWRQWRSRLRSDAAAGVAADICLSCGRQCSAQKVHESKIKGLPGPGRGGVSLIAYDSDSFQSYGLEKSLNAPVCGNCVDCYVAAINGLIANRPCEEDRPAYGGSVTVGEITFCYWCRSPLTADPMRLLFEAPVAGVAELLKAVRGGHAHPIEAAATDRFFVMPISAPSKGRAVVHDWITTALPRVCQNVATWFDQTSIIDPFTGDLAEPVRLSDPPKDATSQEKAAILRRCIPSALGRWNKERRRWDVPTDFLRSVVRTAVCAEPLPLAVLHAALARLRADVHDSKQGPLPGFTNARLGLMRAVLNQHVELLWKGEPIMPGLDRSRQDPAYVCGRLFAVLARAQAAAIAPNKEDRLCASIVSRYYGSASARPATGLYVPVRMRIAHLSKLDRDAPGLAIRFRRELSEIFDLLGADGARGLPEMLSPAEQCVFAIGFEHQMAELWRKKPDGGVTSDQDIGTCE